MAASLASKQMATGALHFGQWKAKTNDPGCSDIAAVTGAANSARTETSSFSRIGASGSAGYAPDSKLLWLKYTP